MDYAVAARKSGAVQRLPIASRPAESRLGRIGPISRGTKRTGERSASKSHATFDAAGAGNVMMAAGLRAPAKAVEPPPEPKIGAPVLDPTTACGKVMKIGNIRAAPDDRIEKVARGSGFLSLAGTHRTGITRRPRL